MKPSLLKLVDVILAKIEDSPELRVSEGGLRSWLRHEGYNKREIDQALRLIGRRLATDARPQQEPPTRRVAMRVLTPHEDFKLGADARDALYRLELLGLIDPVEREMLLDRLPQVEGIVGLDELDYLLSSIIASTRDYETQQTVMTALDGDRDLYH